MMPIWIFAIFIVLFVVVIVWERFSFIMLKKEYETIEFFLDLYVKKYGQLDGMVIVEEGSDTRGK